MFLVTLTCTVTRGKPDMPTLNPTSSPGLFAPPIFSGKSPRDEVALNPTLMALRLMAGTRPNFSYPNSCYKQVCGGLKAWSSQGTGSRCIPTDPGSVTPSSIVAHCGAVSCLRKQYDDAANVDPNLSTNYGSFRLHFRCIHHEIMIIYTQCSDSIDANLR